MGGESEGRTRAEPGLVCSVNPEKKSPDPNNRRSTQLKISDLLIKAPSVPQNPSFEPVESSTVKS